MIGRMVFGKKAQITAEFLIVVIGLFLMLSVSFTVYSNNLALFSDFQLVSEMRANAAGIGNAIDSLAASGNGASAEFYFGKSFDYNASIPPTTGLVVLRSRNAIVDFPTATSDIDFTNFSFNKRLRVSNNLGKVVFENA